MKTYDIIVIGSGAGNIVADEAVLHDYSVALVDRGPIGGTCLNLGCIPSKMLIYPADRIVEIQESVKLGIFAAITDVDFPGIMERMRNLVSRDLKEITQRMRDDPGMDLYEAQARFVDDYTLEVGRDTLKGDKIVIAAGASPAIPPVKGIEETGYLTNESVLRLTRKPESIIIIGGGYIAVEYGHFFSAMGTDVTVLHRGDRLLKNEEPEISHLLKEKLGTRMKIYTDTEAVQAFQDKGAKTVVGEMGEERSPHYFTAEEILVAAGRKSNAPGLAVSKTGVKTDDRGYIKTNAYLETSKKHIWAIGDVIGKGMYRHAANYEAMLVCEAIFHGNRMEMDYQKVPHAVFSYPEIASVGFTESGAIERFGAAPLLKGVVKYTDTARGEAMMEKEGFAKIILNKETQSIAGFHIMGPHASILIQEIVNSMSDENGLSNLMAGIHIHPALTEMIPDIFQNLEEI